MGWVLVISLVVGLIFFPIPTKRVFLVARVVITKVFGGLWAALKAQWVEVGKVQEQEDTDKK